MNRSNAFTVFRSQSDNVDNGQPYEMTIPSETPERSCRPVPLSYQSNIITDTPDIPVDVNGYERNVKTRKAAVGIFSVLGLLISGAIIAKHPASRKADAMCQWIDVGFQVSTICFDALSWLSLRFPLGIGFVRLAAFPVPSSEAGSTRTRLAQQHYQVLWRHIRTSDHLHGSHHSHLRLGVHVARSSIQIQSNSLFVPADNSAMAAAARRLLKHGIIPRCWDDAPRTEKILSSSADATWVRATGDARRTG
jgi:hypothetical protein